MQNDNDNRPPPEDGKPAGRILSPAAQRALQEAAERRQNHKAIALPQEFGGRGGEDPARFGDWEINGRAIDF